MDEWCFEVPAGGTHDTCDATLEDVVRKELREEIGASAASLKYVGFFYSAYSMTDENCYVFLAERVEITKEEKTETTESIEIQMVPVAEAVELAPRRTDENGTLCAGSPAVRVADREIYARQADA